MDYIEYQIAIADDQAEEIAVAELAELGFESFEREGDSLHAYITDEAHTKTKNQIDKYLKNNKLKYTSGRIGQQNWNAVWESNFEPIVVDGRCAVYAPFHKGLPRYEYNIEIMPKMSFGTGHHATTHLMISRMLATRFKGETVLDMGSGTGVLAILAAMIGAFEVDAIDIDPWAYENMTENIRANGVAGRVHPHRGDAALLAEQEYDVILANINRNILLDDMERYVSVLNPGGKIIFSGILEEDIPLIAARAASLGLTLSHTAVRDKWALLEARKSNLSAATHYF